MCKDTVGSEELYIQREILFQDSSQSRDAYLECLYLDLMVCQIQFSGYNDIGDSAVILVLCIVEKRLPKPKLGPSSNRS